MRRARLALFVGGGALLLLSASVGGGAGVATVVRAQLTSEERELTVQEIEDLTGVDLPEGAEVLDSDYESALDWSMTATVRLPEGSSPPVLDPGLVWDGASVGPDGVVREATTIVDDGRLILDLRAFDV